MKLKYKIGLFIVATLIAICLMSFQSYALWVQQLASKNENIINVGCFQIEFEEKTENIQLMNSYPMSDKLGLSTTPYTFTISNQCSIASSYVVTLNTLLSNQIEAHQDKDPNYSYESYNMKEKIKFALSEKDFKPSSGILLSEYAKTHLNKDLDEIHVEELDESIILAKGTLKGKENEEIDQKKYNLYLWIDEKAGNEVMKQHFEASIYIINRATSLTENQETIFPETVIDELDDDGNGLITQTHEDYVGEEEGWKTDELRYVGPNPNNYIEFNGETNTWRIIGLVNVKTNSGIEPRIKIIREQKLEESMAWDSSGKNDWTQSSLMQYLNEGEYYHQLQENAKNMIDEDIIWNIGGWNTSKVTMASMYGNERGTNTFGGQLSEWSNGKVGLMYPSDYGYATSGGIEITRTNCLDTEMFSWRNSEDCYNNDWLLSASGWLLTPDISDAYSAFFLLSEGWINKGADIVSDEDSIHPVVYLKPSVTISGGNGSIENNFKLNQIEIP